MSRLNRGLGKRGSELLSLNSILRMKDQPLLTAFSSEGRIFSERSSLPRALALAAAGLLLTVLPLAAKAPAKAKPKMAPLETAVIENTGSTNTTGYKIIVYPIGGARIGAEVRGLPLAMNKRLFADLKAAMPLASLPVRHGMHSMSFGTQTFITYKGQKSPDLTFASDPRTAALRADIDAITKTLGVGNAPKHPIVIHSDK